MDGACPEFPDVLERLVSSLAGPAESWTTVRIVEVPLGRGSLAYPHWSQMYTSEDFARDRWLPILESVDRSWVNVTAYGVRDCVLIVGVEWFPAQNPDHARPGEINVALAGGAGPFSWPWSRTST